MNQTAWVYCAVSSEEQAKNLADDQLAWAQRTASANGWTITRVFGGDEQGVGSGARGIRKILRQLLDELTATPKKQRPARILLSRVDRLGREALDVVAAIAQIRQLGVLLHTREDGDLTIDRASDTLKPVLRALTGALENEARSDKWKAVHARRRAQGLHIGIVPFGVILVDGRAVPYEPEAVHVRTLFERAADGWGYTRLARYMREVAPSKRLADGTSRTLSWAPSTVKSVLDSSTIRAVVVDADLWDRAHAARALDFRARSPKRWPWPLAGAVRCTCGKMLKGHTGGIDPNFTRYYICRNHSLEPGQKTHPSHRADKLEAAFVDVLRRLSANPGLFLEAERTNTDELRVREREQRAALADVDRRRQACWKLAEDGGLSGSQVRERLDQLDGERARLSADLTRTRALIADAQTVAHSARAVSDVIAILEQSWELADTEQRQEIARAVAALPAVGGLFADPAKRSVLIVGADVAKMHKADASRMVATSVLVGNLVRAFSMTSGSSGKARPAL